MASNMLIDIRPPHPPRIDPLAEGTDQFHPAVTNPELLALPLSTAAAFATARERVSEHQGAASDDRTRRAGDDVVIVPLGTSSAAPTKYRNGKLSKCL